MLGLAQIIDDFDLTFDPGDPRNGSLYVGTARAGGSTLDLAATLAALRAAALWSPEPTKTIPDAHRPAYKEQLVLVDVAEFGGATGFIIVRCDHPKFPSDGERWAAWRAFFTHRAGASAGSRD
ncbi:MAG: hypothetical protein EXR83_12240 [Gammaproteobacteria bacterium]|nr:hypothetical protein [Gammaproteobacteria bacterium]